MRDNPVSTALVGLIIAFMVLQAMVTGLSRSAMAGNWSIEAAIICSSGHEAGFDQTSPDPTFPDKLPADHLCASLCHLAGHGLAALPANAAAAQLAPYLIWSDIVYAALALPIPVSLHRHGGARAPPHFS